MMTLTSGCLVMTVGTIRDLRPSFACRTPSATSGSLGTPSIVLKKFDAVYDARLFLARDIESIQYLLCSLPVVSTPSKGGGDILSTNYALGLSTLIREP